MHAAATEELLQRHDQELDAALTAGDGPELRRLLAEDYCHNHSYGLLRGKADYIAHVTARTDLPRRDVSDISVQQHGDVAVTTGRIDVRYPEGPARLKRYVRVWRHASDGAWRLLSNHSYPVSDRDPGRPVH